jgi:TolB protein
MGWELLRQKQGAGRVWTTAATWLAAAMLAAGADVIVVKGGAAKTGLDLTGLRSSGLSGDTFCKTLENDLRLSGWFAIVKGGGVVAVSGSCAEAAGRLQVNCRVAQVTTGRTYLQRSYSEAPAQARDVAHQLADEIVKAVMGKRGIASTHIVTVGRRGGKKDLYLCDADGAQMRQLTRDGSPCLGPSWSPTGAFLVYTSFRSGYPDVYMIGLSTLSRTQVASYPGLNSGGDVSPDGRRVVLTLSKDGNPDLYVLEVGSRRATRLTRTRFAAEASASWSPDGNSVVFVSDQSGSPQLYEVSSAGAGYRRLTFRGSENVAPDWGPDGRIAYSSKREGKYHVCVMNAGGGGEIQLTREYADFEDPSWAPDGRHIVCSRTVDYRSDLCILDTMGDPPIRLTTTAGDWYCPAWSP